MRITYDPEADILHIQLRDDLPADATDIDKGIRAEYNDDGRMVGLEILDAKLALGSEAVGSVHYELLTLTMPDNEE